jgi:type IV secretory pathway VirB10-like protein
MPDKQIDSSLTQGQLPKGRTPRIFVILVLLMVAAAFAIGFGAVHNNQQLAADADSIPTPPPNTQKYGESPPGGDDATATPAPRATPLPTPAPVPYNPAPIVAAAAPDSPPPTIQPAQEGEHVVFANGQRVVADPQASNAGGSAAGPGGAAFANYYAGPTSPIQMAQGGAQAGPQTVPAIANEQAAHDQPYPFAMPNVQSTPAPVDIEAGRRVLAQFDEDVDSDLPGIVTAHIIGDVCDKRNRAVAWAGGATLVGTTENTASASRHLGVHFYRLTQPDQTRIALDDTQMQDTGGHNGVTGRVTTHSWEMFRDETLDSIAAAAGQIISSAVSHGGGVNVSTAPQSPFSTGKNYATSFTIQANTPFYLTLASAYDVDAPYHGEFCRDT